MIRIKRITLFLLIVVIIVSSIMIFDSTFYVFADSTKHIDAVEIKTNRGDPAPDFTLENMNGDKVSLNDFRGNVLVLGIVFFPDGEESIRDIEKYRKGVISGCSEKGVNFLKVMEIKKPVFMKKKFILSKMKDQLEGIPDAPKNTLVDWGGSLKLFNKYGIKDKEVPSLFVIGIAGNISYAFQGWYNENNMKRLDKEVNNILN